MPKKTDLASAKRGAASASSCREDDDSPGVTSHVARIKHPLKPTLQAIRRAILAADPAITEGIKWNSPSFYCQGWFATISSHKPTQLDVVFFCGAKVRSDCTVREVINDPDGLLTWPSKDRALLSFKADVDFHARLKSFQRIARQWTGYQTRNAVKA